LFISLKKRCKKPVKNQKSATKAKENAIMCGERAGHLEKSIQKTTASEGGYTRGAPANEIKALQGLAFRKSR